MNAEVIEETRLTNDSIYKHQVILFNDDHNAFEFVEYCLMDICKKTKKEAKKIAMEAHTTGKSVCYTGSLEECETVGEKLASQDLTVSVQ